MSAEEWNAKVTVRFEMSELDRQDGLRINPKKATYNYRDKVSNVDESKASWTVQQITGLQLEENLVSNIDFSKGKVLNSSSKIDGISYTVVNSNNRNELVTKTTSWDFVAESILKNGSDVTVIINLTTNRLGVDGGTDDVDDRLQKTYGVHLEKAPGTGLYYLEDNYTVNAKDDIAKLVTSGEYVNLPGWDTPDFDGEDEYYYHYEIKDGAIYGTYVKSNASKFAKVEAEKEYDELDANKDGVVSCEEALGKGWVWNNETSACELKGSSNTGSYVPNTATK